MWPAAWHCRAWHCAGILLLADWYLLLIGDDWYKLLLLHYRQILFVFLT
jgi:hypothetical protein